MPNSKQKISLINRFCNLSTRGQFLFFILTFALLGGAYFVYSSFAFTNQNVGFSNIRIGKITPGSGHVGVDIW